MTFKLGADPEFFLIDTETGKHVSAHGMIPGTKSDPFPVENGAVQVDGMALEFNINPASTLKEWEKNLTSVISQLRGMVDKRYAFDFSPVAHFGKEYIDAQPEEAKLLGCDPDYNAWTGEINPKPDGDLGIRTASGHVHIGWTEGQDITHPDHIEACQMMSKQCDFYLGLPSMVWDEDRVRRSMYGDFGAYRPKHYGVEYRTMSNKWVNDKELREFVFNSAANAYNKLLDGRQSYGSVYNPSYYDLYSWDERSKACNDIFYATRMQLPKKFWAHRSRTHVVELRSRMMEEGSFFDIRTGELVSWEDAGESDVRNGFLKYQNEYARYSKIKGLNKMLTEADYNERAKTVKKYSAKPWVVTKSDSFAIGNTVTHGL